MSDIKLVTGYVPIANHPRSATEYGWLGESIFGNLNCENFTIHPFYEDVRSTWLHALIEDAPFKVTPSIADNPAKNTLAYHCANHQKFGWLFKAAYFDPTPSTFVWMDYGIGHVPGVTAEVVQDFMDRVRPGDFAIPGCWEKEYAKENSNYLWPNWRFCGGLMVVPRDQVEKLYKAIKWEVGNHVKRTQNITWEVNSLANVEKRLPGLRWYKADHDQTMFTNYGAPQCLLH